MIPDPNIVGRAPVICEMPPINRLPTGIIPK